MERIKFVTNFPRDMTDDLLQAMRDLPRVARYLHVPLQSGCDDVLRRMKRGYTVAEYRDMHERIRATLPDCSVSSDFIVGFCGESEESFQKSVDAVHEFRFKNSFIFKYSPRPGTKAHDLYLDDVPDEVKRRRNQELLHAQSEISAEENCGFVGRTVTVLVEGPSKAALRSGGRDDLPGWHGGAEGSVPAAADSAASISNHPPLNTHHSPVTALQLTGRTTCDRIVAFDGNPRLAGTLAQVEIHDCTPTTLLGGIVTRQVTHATPDLLPILSQ
jgi:tRNA-2-methylthio-N6-dimethylallyladenosine synthase